MEIIERLQKAAAIYQGDAIKTRNPEQISTDRAVLSGLYTALGDEVAESKKTYEMADFDAKTKRLKLYKSLRDEGNGPTDAEKLSRLGVKDDEKAVLDLKHHYHRMKNLLDGTKEMLNSLASRIKVLESQARNNY